MKRIRSVTIRGKRYKFKWKKFKKDWGKTESPNSPAEKRCISINSDLKKVYNEKLFLDTLIHEYTHGFFWDLDEEAIGQFATELSSFLYKLGWRVHIDLVEK